MFDLIVVEKYLNNIEPMEFYDQPELEIRCEIAKESPFRWFHDPTDLGVLWSKADRSHMAILNLALERDSIIFQGEVTPMVNFSEHQSKSGQFGIVASAILVKMIQFWT